MPPVQGLAEAHVVEDGGRPRAQRLDGAGHGAEIDLPVGQLERLCRPQERHHDLHRQVFAPALDVVVPGMEVAVDHPGGSQHAGSIDDLVGVLDRAGGRDGSDAVVLNQDVLMCGVEVAARVAHHQAVAEQGLDHRSLRIDKRRG